MRQMGPNLGIDQGSCLMFSDFADDGPMWAGEGRREARQSVTFAAAFAAVPVVSVGLSMWDMDSRTNPRLDISAEKISAAGFDLVFRTWGDSRIARVRADWMAIGPVRDEDDWEIG
ncbi:MAG: H-type lectin domain-containing protein [Rhodobacteraceae bacterium]|jgi:hypothetical protein|nr:H-type lectin domain-containing protein [Paracoccaceae bacterium]